MTQEQTKKKVFPKVCPLSIISRLCRIGHALLESVLFLAACLLFWLLVESTYYIALLPQEQLNNLTLGTMLQALDISMMVDHAFYTTIILFLLRFGAGLSSAKPAPIAYRMDEPIPRNK